MSCKYCKDDTNCVESMHRDSKGYFSLSNEYMEVIADDGNNIAIDTFKINYCPMCGSRVNEYKDFE